MIYKLKIKEPSFQVTANLDERVKTSKNKLVVKQPTLYKLRPKPNGLVINTSKNNVILKTENGNLIILKYSQGTAVYKQTG